MGWANQLCKNVVPSFTRLYCYIIYLLNNILDSIHLSSQLKEIKFPKSFEKVQVPITSRFLLTWWKPRYVSIEWVAKKSSPLQSKIIRKPFNACNNRKVEKSTVFEKIISPAKTFHHLVTDCHMWWNPAYNDYQGFLLFLAEILENKNVIIIFNKKNVK